MITEHDAAPGEQGDHGRERPEQLQSPPSPPQALTVADRGADDVTQRRRALGVQVGTQQRPQILGQPSFTRPSHAWTQ
ncbi:hypothetical protein [Actinoplanes sp. NPDC026619]|uniref:hypothetical protein n=1 Tax=Actinoplanes sp. NPDC026619 TaxID=3155798 RepID=UPI0033CE8C82